MIRDYQELFRLAAHHFKSPVSKRTLIAEEIRTILIRLGVIAPTVDESLTDTLSSFCREFSSYPDWQGTLKSTLKFNGRNNIDSDPLVGRGGNITSVIDKKTFKNLNVFMQRHYDFIKKPIEERITAEKLEKMLQQPEKLEKKSYKTVVPKLKELQSIIASPDASDDDRFYATQFYKKYLREFAEANSQSEIYQEIMVDYRKADKIRAGAVEKVKDRLKGISHVTEDESLAWAKTVKISEASIKKLKRIKYSMDDFIRDMAEFHQVTNGRVKLVQFEYIGDNRAHTTGVGEVDRIPTVYIDHDFSKSTMWHEMGHHIEEDPIANKLARDYIQKRSEDKKLYKLRLLAGGNYRNDEVAYKGGFFNPYVGKYYEHGITEVFACVMGALADKNQFLRYFEEDPETFNLVLGYLISSETATSKKILEEVAELRQEIVKKGDKIEIVKAKILESISIKNIEMNDVSSLYPTKDAEFIMSAMRYSVYRGDALEDFQLYEYKDRTVVVHKQKRGKFQVFYRDMRSGEISRTGSSKYDIESLNETIFLYLVGVWDRIALLGVRSKELIQFGEKQGWV